jgi:hypothetical protein
MPTAVTDEIRAATRAVAARAVHVRIAEDRLAAYAASFPIRSGPAPQLDPTRHYLGHGDGTVAFALVLDTVNFGSGYFAHPRKRSGMSGYFTVASSLTDYFARCGVPPAAKLAGLTAGDCAAIFGQDLGDEVIRELMELFATALRELGRYVAETFSGSFVRFIEAGKDQLSGSSRFSVPCPTSRTSRTTAAFAFPSASGPSSPRRISRWPSTARVRGASPTWIASRSSPTTWCRTCCGPASSSTGNRSRSVSTPAT